MVRPFGQRGSGSVMGLLGELVAERLDDPLGLGQLAGELLLTEDLELGLLLGLLLTERPEPGLDLSDGRLGRCPLGAAPSRAVH